MDKEFFKGMALAAVLWLLVGIGSMAILLWWSSVGIKKESVEIYINGLAALGTMAAVIVALATATRDQRRKTREARDRAQLTAIRHLASVSEVLRLVGKLQAASADTPTPQDYAIRLNKLFLAETERVLPMSEEDVLAITAILPNAAWNIGRSMGILRIIRDEVGGILEKNHVEPAMSYSAKGETPPERWMAAIGECSVNLHAERVQMEKLAKWNPGTQGRFS